MIRDNFESQFHQFVSSVYQVALNGTTLHKWYHCLMHSLAGEHLGSQQWFPLYLTGEEGYYVVPTFTLTMLIIVVSKVDRCCVCTENLIERE